MSIAALKKILADRLLQNEPMAKHTAARLGGVVDWLYVAKRSVEDLAEVVQTAWMNEIPVRVIGSGANILISDQGVRGLIVINRVSEIQFDDWYDGHDKYIVSVSSGANLSTLAYRCQSRGLAGFEWAVNIPGTVGGAIVNNAGAHGGDMAQCVVDVMVVEEDGQKLYSNADMQYAYRHSVLKARKHPDYVILRADLILSRDDPDVIKAQMGEFIAYRKKTQPPGASLGSIFKNPPGDHAGRLIEAAGLKGYQVGSAMVSPVHANFFINGVDQGGVASANDYRNLIFAVQEKVYQHSKIKLELEIELIGEWD